MTTPSRIKVQTLNQPSSYFAFEAELSAAKLAEILGWDPNGPALASVLADLLSGQNRIVRTTQVPGDKGTDCVEFHISPIANDVAEVDPLDALDPDEAEVVAGEWVEVGPDWGSDATAEECEAACARATDWLTEHEGPRLSIEFRAARQGEAAGTYQRRTDGSLQIHGYTLPVPDLISDLIKRAWVHAGETWPNE
jgi:hypothetical protein